MKTLSSNSKGLLFGCFLGLFTAFCNGLNINEINTPRCVFGAWTDFALETQRNISLDIPINEQIFPASYNSFQVDKTGSGFAWHAVPVEQQLNQGVRHLSLPIHVLAGSYRVCYSGDTNTERQAYCNNNNFEQCKRQGLSEDVCANTPGLCGCTENDPLLSDAFTQIASWLLLNRNEVVIIELIDTTCSLPQSNSAILSAIQPLLSHVYTPVNYTSNGSAWPTPAEMKAINRTVLMHSRQCDHSLGLIFLNIALPSLPPAQLPTVEYFVTQQGLSFPECLAAPLPQFTAVHGNAAELNGMGTYSTYAVNLTMLFLNCQLSMAIDLADSKTLSRTVWTWDRTTAEPNPEGRCAVLQRENAENTYTTERWRAENCTVTTGGTAHPYACRVTGHSLSNGLWVITTATGDWPIPVCPGGSTFSFPKSPAENMLLRNTLRASTHTAVWINFSDLELRGTWKSSADPAATWTGRDQAPMNANTTRAFSVSLGADCNGRCAGDYGYDNTTCCPDARCFYRGTCSSAVSENTCTCYQGFSGETCLDSASSASSSSFVHETVDNPLPIPSASTYSTISSVLAVLLILGAIKCCCARRSQKKRANDIIATQKENNELAPLASSEEMNDISPRKEF